MSEERHVLPTSVVPTHYHLSILPDLEAAVFSAQVTIDVDIAEPTEAITLNAEGLAFSQLTVALRREKSEESSSSGTAGEAAVSVLSVVESAEDQRITLRLSAPVAGAARLTFHYTAAISDTLFGFYRSHYTFHGEKKFVGATQLCPAEARRVFPCWDEPSVKATFALDLTLPAHMQAFSNAPPTATVPTGSGLVRWEFRPAYAMSTYLLAWVVGELESTETTVPHAAVPLARGLVEAADGTAAESFVLRAVTPKGKIAQAAFALDVAARVLPLYEECFQCRYVFPKIDLVALPNFAFGAMENWGCITFREQALLVTQESSKVHREHVATVVAHELAHQWFGNLATMAWWSDLWLNESFATYMATWAVNKLYPDWAADTQFVYTEGSRAFQLDALRSSHPIEMTLRDVREVDGIFDAISYSKGAMVLRMTAKFIGETGFQRGLVDYLSRYSFAAATSVQLWECLSAPAAPNLREVLQSWTTVQGYPYLTASHDPATDTLTLQQQRFLVVKDATPAEDAALWKIPMYYSYAAADGTVVTEPLVMSDRTVTIKVAGASWVKVNTDQIAFCRVQYSTEMLRSLVAAIEGKAVSGTDRYAMAADAAAFARGGYGSTAEALALLAHYHGEDDCAVWCELVEFERKVRYLVAASQSAAVAAAFNAYCRRLYRPAMDRLGLAPSAREGFRADQLRVMLFDRLLACEDEDMLAKARELYAQRATSPVSVSLTAAVFGVRVQEGGEAALAEVTALLGACTDAEMRSHYLSALSAVPAPLMERVVDLLLSEAVASQDVTTVLAGFARRADTEESFVRALIGRWPALSHKLPTLMLGRLVKLVEYCCSPALAAELRTFFDGLPAEMQSRLRMTFQQGIESLLCNAAWAERDLPGITEYLLGA